MTRTQFLAREGFRGLGIGILVFVIAFLLELEFIVFCTLLFLVVWIFIFRNPERHPLEHVENAILAPSDGKIIDIQYKEGLIIVDIRIDWIDVGILRAPYQTQGVTVDTQYGLRSVFVSKDIREKINTKIVFKSDYFDLIIRPEFFKASIYPLHQIYANDRIGFCKLGDLRVVFKDTFLDLRVNAGDTIKGGETLLGYAK